MRHPVDMPVCIAKTTGCAVRLVSRRAARRGSFRYHRVTGADTEGRAPLHNPQHITYPGAGIDRMTQASIHI